MRISRLFPCLFILFFASDVFAQSKSIFGAQLNKGTKNIYGTKNNSNNRNIFSGKGKTLRNNYFGGTPSGRRSRKRSSEVKQPPTNWASMSVTPKRKQNIENAMPPEGYEKF